MATTLEVRFDSGDAWCSASLYRPDGSGPHPVIVMGHGLGGLRQMRLPAFAERFVDAGYACLVFDYRHFGSSGGEPRQLLDIKRQLQDWQSALRYVRGRAELNSAKIVLWGSSFGGGHVLVAAADDGKVAAVVSQCPFTDGLSSAMAANPISSAKVTALAALDKLGASFGRAPIMVALAGQPGAAALMTAPDCEPGYLRLVPPGLAFQNQVAARFGLDIVRYFPGRRTSDITCPVLFCVCETDTVAPAKATLRHARKAPKGEIKRYRDGHFDIYVGEGFERVVGDQIEFLRRHIPTA
ncbi:alpha/beta hydrolase [Nevskia ramosa]|uniref:alpha/beta hydrolase n=2 Tax=Nevskia ramosa TaxID=64002 RepID=UPI0003B78144|nr:alpha/beta fold hydrolase [Nevskia ramosa]